MRCQNEQRLTWKICFCANEIAKNELQAICCVYWKRCSGVITADVQKGKTAVTSSEEKCKFNVLYPFFQGKINGRQFVLWLAGARTFICNYLCENMIRAEVRRQLGIMCNSDRGL